MSAHKYGVKRIPCPTAHGKQEDRMETKIYGYVKVSNIDQNEDRQMMALRKVYVPVKNIYINKF